ncbi:hypothetical protein ERJ75_000686700 [Trypanosoma vivax]|nr:hypothetical protein ERJ75_000686700 [Trypanosoma vivax]
MPLSSFARVLCISFRCRALQLRSRERSQLLFNLLQFREPRYFCEVPRVGEYCVVADARAAGRASGVPVQPRSLLRLFTQCVDVGCCGVVVSVQCFAEVFHGACELSGHQAQCCVLFLLEVLFGLSPELTRRRSSLRCASLLPGCSVGPGSSCLHLFPFMVLCSADVSSMPSFAKFPAGVHGALLAPVANHRVLAAPSPLLLHSHIMSEARHWPAFRPPHPVFLEVLPPSSF